MKGDGLESFKQQYKSYKESYAKYMEFDQDDPNLSEYSFSPNRAKSYICVSGVTLADL